jgi:hypothetical protein
LRISVIRDLDIHAAGGDHETMPMTTEAELVKRNSANNQARFYRLAIWPGLFGGYSRARSTAAKCDNVSLWKILKHFGQFCSSTGKCLLLNITNFGLILDWPAANHFGAKWVKASIFRARS